MKAAILSELKKPLLILDDLCLPDPIHGQVLVKIEFTGICHSQLMEIDGYRGKDNWLPHCLGHEAVGVVVASGKGVKKVKEGDRVVVGWIRCKGINAQNPTYSSKTIGTVNAGSCTTVSNFSIISENRVSLLPKEFPVELGALLGCALPTGAGIVINQMKPASEDNVLIVVLGGIGFSSLIALRALGNKNIICIDIDDSKLKTALHLGASKVINGKKFSVDIIKKKLKEYTNNQGIDYAIEAAGLTETIELSFECLSSRGTLFFASHPKFGDKIKLDPFELISGKNIFGSWGGQSDPDKFIPKFTKLIRGSEGDLETLVDRFQGIDKINEAISSLRMKKINRAMIDLRYE